MFSISTAFVAVSAFTSLASAQYAPFIVDYMFTKQPNGNPDGQENQYAINFNVSSLNNGNQSAFCYTIWGDNNNNNFCDSDCEAYSTNVPTGSWIQCAVSEAQSDITDLSSEFAFQLFPYFSIGNFSIAIQQNITKFINGSESVTSLESDLVNPYHITNTTSAFSCDIDPIEVQYEQHASGVCTTGGNFTDYTIPVVSTSVGPPCDVEIAWIVDVTTRWGDNIFVVGNITELGNWNPYDGVALNADAYRYGGGWEGTVEIPAGTPFEYKYIEWAINATLIWETGDNRVATAMTTCGYQGIGDDPDVFRK